MDCPPFRWKWTLALVGLLLHTGLVRGQEEWSLRWDDRELEHFDARYPSRASALDAVRSALSELQLQGYLDARIDTVRDAPGGWNCTAHRGTRYTFGTVQWSGDSILHRRLASQVADREGAAFTPESWSADPEAVLRFLEDNGYPFATVAAKTLDIRNGTVDVAWEILPGPHYTIDSLVIKSSTPLPARYLHNYLGIRRSMPYTESTVRAIRDRLGEIPFLRAAKDAEVVFREKTADIYIYPEKKKANSFNGVLGIQPSENDRPVTLTGDLEVRLLNGLNRGEEIYFNWRRLQSQTQDLHARTQWPFLFNTPFGAEAQVRIYRRDTTFSSLRTVLAAVFSLRGNDQARAFVERNQNNQLSRVITAAGAADIQSTLYGLSLRRERLDYRLNPRYGWAFQADGALGRRSSTPVRTDNEAVASTSSDVYRFQGQVDTYLPVFRRFALRTAVQGGAYLTDDIVENEMYRIGGLRTLRGFDEESLFATSWGVGTVEYRFLLDRNSAIYLYAEQAWYEKKATGQFVTDTPRGFGAGLNLDTGNGIFTFNYGLGRQFDNPWLVRSAKISFGFRSIF